MCRGKRGVLARYLVGGHLGLLSEATTGKGEKFSFLYLDPP